KTPLNAVVINWSVNGVLQQPFQWKAASATDAIIYGDVSPEITVGTFHVPDGMYKVVAWTEAPNGYSDLNRDNDTATVEVRACVTKLSGSYIVGGSNPDFSTLEEAMSMLTSCGVKGPVVLKLSSGNYDALSVMGVIPGTSDSNTITFTSAADCVDSVLIGAWQSPSLNLSNSSHLVFERVTIGNINTINEVAVTFSGFNENILFHQCNLLVNPNTSGSNSRVVEYANSYSEANYLSNVRFVGNNVRGGYYGFYLCYAGGHAANCMTSASKRAGIRMDSNHIYDQKNSPIYSYYYTHIESFSYNIIESRPNSDYNNSVNFQQYNLIDSIIGNKIHNSGLLLHYINNLSIFGADIMPVIVSNNEIICISETSVSGISTSCVNACLINNSIYCKAPTTYCLQIGGQWKNDTLNILNNIIMSENGETANYLVYFINASSLSGCQMQIDNNDYYTTGTNKYNFYAGGIFDFANWKSNYKMDSSSVQVKPDFNNLPDNLSIGCFDSKLKCNRHHLVLCDIDGKKRYPFTNMGCYSDSINRYCVVLLSVNDSSMGVTCGAGTYMIGDTVTLTATALQHYHFTQWNDGDTTNPRVVTLLGDTSFTASFAPNSYQLAVVSSDTVKGRVSGGGNYTYQSQVKVTATPKYGYHFTQWNDGDTTNPRVVTLLG
ncbi:MAG: hypothetical protein J6X35_07115, partial [Bacteroidales bacterium]|nr:hypothetical protein [Bacteroidales bacterium]